MLPTTRSPPPSPPDHHHHSPSPSPKKPSKNLMLNHTTIIRSVKSTISIHHCAWLLITVLLQILILLFLNRSSPSPSIANLHRQFQSSPSPLLEKIDTSNNHQCPYGTVYVYDLPPALNKDLLDNCEDLDPWSSRCNAVSNGGFGPVARGLESIVPENLRPAWYWTDMYASEVIYHDRIMSYPCRTSSPEYATGFYIPFYVGLAVGKYLWGNYTARDRDKHSNMMLDWVSSQVPWKKTNGSDHFLMIGRLTWDFRRLTVDSDTEWGTRFIYMPLMKNVLRLTVERSQWDPLEFSVPYPTAFHPRSKADISQWQRLVRGQKRDKLCTFVGATRKKIKNDFRGLLMEYCKKENEFCRVVDCSVAHCYDGAPAILEAFLTSTFCLQPKGDGFTRRSMYDCMLAGSIPVYFWKGSFQDQYQWHLPGSAKTYSVYIDNNGVRNDTSIIRNVLEMYSDEQVKKMRETIIDFMPRFLYKRSDGDLGDVKDAFDIAMDGVLRRFKQQKELQNKEEKKINR